MTREIANYDKYLFIYISLHMRLCSSRESHSSSSGLSVINAMPADAFLFMRDRFETHNIVSRVVTGVAPFSHLALSNSWYCYLFNIYIYTYEYFDIQPCGFNDISDKFFFIRVPICFRNSCKLQDVPFAERDGRFYDTPLEFVCRQLCSLCRGRSAVGLSMVSFMVS